ncbi:helix-hairpin-helix domain-containing protein [Enterococcus faecalis]
MERIKAFSKREWVIVLAVFGGFLVTSSLFLIIGKQLQHQGEPTVVDVARSSTLLEETTSSTVIVSQNKIYVDLKGAVNIPGMYQVTEAMRVWDVIALAGGVTETADTTQVNYSQKVTDQMIIYVPQQGEQGSVNQATMTSSSDQSQSQQPINLNTATESELQTISGIGLKKAQEIIRYREENGPFKAVSDLQNVAGIGEKTVERLKEFLTVE